MSLKQIHESAVVYDLLLSDFLERTIKYLIYCDVQAGCSPFNDLQICDNGDFCEGFNMDDVGLCFEKSDEVFGYSQSHSRYLYGDVGMDCLFMEKNFSVVDSDTPNENITEVC